VNAYLAPRLAGYLASLQQEIKRQFTFAQRHAVRRPTTSAPRLYLMQSSGGITTAARAMQEPVRTILSGPAGGVVATAWLADRLGLRHVISFDMGGTSADVCLLPGPGISAARTTHETVFAGLPVAVPILDVHSVGAGGGSLARIDAGGALRVGPQSAGALPGPACYARGGSQATVTDANLVLGRLDPDHFLGGSARLDPSAAQIALRQLWKRGKADRRAWSSVQDLASGIVAVANATMEKALRVISVDRGHDPRQFSLVCFGGAGGLHAADLARLLGLAQVIVPSNPGAFSALGVLLSDVVTDRSQSMFLELPAAGGPDAPRIFKALEERFLRLERSAVRQLRKEGFDPKGLFVERYVALRYRGQSYELPVPYARSLAADFHHAHQQAYGYSDPQRSVEVISLRIRLVIPTPKPILRAVPLPRSTKKLAPSSAALLKRKPVWFGRRFLPAPLYDRERLSPGAAFAGPAVVVEYSATTVIPPDFSCRVDRLRNLVLVPA
jgi:N-methylhydantoinase A